MSEEFVSVDLGAGGLPGAYNRLDAINEFCSFPAILYAYKQDSDEDGIEDTCAFMIIYNTYINKCIRIGYVDRGGDETKITSEIWNKFVKSIKPSMASYSDPAVIKQVQEKLTSIGYDCGVADGSSGPITQSAIFSYNMDHELNIVSDIDPVLLNSLKINVSYYDMPVIQRGVVGDIDPADVMPYQID